MLVVLVCLPKGGKQKKQENQNNMTKQETVLNETSELVRYLLENWGAFKSFAGSAYWATPTRRAHLEIFLKTQYEEKTDFS